MSENVSDIEQRLSLIRRDLNTQSQWTLDDYRDFYQRDVELLLPLAEAFVAAEKSGLIDTQRYLDSLTFEEEKKLQESLEKSLKNNPKFEPKILPKFQLS